MYVCKKNVCINVCIKFMYVYNLSMYDPDHTWAKFPRDFTARNAI